MTPYQGNTGYLFTKLFFSGTPIRENGKYQFPNMKKYRHRLNKDISLHSFTTLQAIGGHTFDLITIYPGLLIGSGYPHDVHADEGLKLGFFFDHTTGLPVVPGSSVKGVLKNVFVREEGNYVKYVLQEMGTEDSDRQLLDSANQEAFRNLNPTPETLKQWTDQIFGNEEEDNLPPSQRDVFFDAFPVESRNDHGLLMGNDYITPHTDPLKNPNPIQFLKVLPHVKFRFDFQLLDSDHGLTANLKRELFRQLLLDFGVGAKTNVGYGQFATDFVQVQASPSGVTNEESTPPQKPGTTRQITLTEVLTRQHLNALAFDELKPVNNEREALIVDENDKEYRLKVLDDCYLVKTKTAVQKKFGDMAAKRIKKNEQLVAKGKKPKSTEYKTLEVGDEITIRINRQSKPGELNYTILPIWLGSPKT